MKTKIVIFVATTLVLAVACKSVSEKDVPEKVKTEFKARFPAITDAKWEMEKDTIYEAEFKVNDQKCSANFSRDGKWLETERKLGKQIPQNLLDSLNKKYPNAEIKRAEESETPEKGKILEVEIKFNKKEIEVQLNADGSIIKEEKEAEDKE
ncbi:MAG: PepSY-like domain-containing protein [Paludibacter sp.]